MNIKVKNLSSGISIILINEPKTYNSLSFQNLTDLIKVFKKLDKDKKTKVIIIEGSGKGFSAGHNLKEVKNLKVRNKYQKLFNLCSKLMIQIVEGRKPVIAKVQGYAIGGGNVLAAICDMTIASENAQFGQVGPKVGSVDPGFGTAYLAQVVGEKKAREIWYLCRRYTAFEALDMGLVNTVVPVDSLDHEVAKWCAEIMERSPTAISIAKRSFNAATDHVKGISSMGMQALALYYNTAESREGVLAFNEKRKPNFRKHLK